MISTPSQYIDLYEKTIGNRYNPKNLVLMLSNQCNLECDHCVVESGHKKGPLLIKEIIDLSISESTKFGISNVLIYGGEPFLQYKELLPYTIDESFKRGMKTVQIGTNGFRGRSRDFAKEIFDAHQEVAKEYDGIICYCISVDEYHQKKIPQTSIANIIQTLKEGNYPNIRIAITTFSSQGSYNDAYGKVFNILKENGIHLLESNDSSYVYPAYLDEIIEVKEENFPLICKNLGIDERGDNQNISEHIGYNFRFGLFDNVIARRMDLGEGLKNYLTFPTGEKTIGQSISKDPILAGRLKPGNQQYPEFYPDGGKNRSDCIIFAPDSNVYMFPAQISKQIAPVPYRGQDFIDLKYEILNAVKGIIE